MQKQTDIPFEEDDIDQVHCILSKLKDHYYSNLLSLHHCSLKRMHKLDITFE